MKIENMSFGTRVFMVVLMFMALILYSVVAGWALTITWGWFVVPVFHTQQLNIPQAIGIISVVGYITYADLRNDLKPSTENITEYITKLAVRPFAFLFTGYILKQFL